MGIALLVGSIGVPTLRGAEGYLPSSGPSVLRFTIPSESAKSFVWPPLFPNPTKAAVSNSTAQAVGPVDQTNAASSLPLSSGLATSNDFFEATSPRLSEPPAVSPPGQVENSAQNPFAEGPEPIITSRMLDDFFKTGPSGDPQTNSAYGGGLQFLPPTAKPLAKRPVNRVAR